MRPMSFDDEQIDKTLSALGAVTPSPGFESRVLRGLEERATEPKEGRSPGGYGGTFRIATALGAALVLVILAFTLSAHRRAHREDIAQVRSGPVLSPRVLPALSQDHVALRDGELHSAVSRSAAVAGAVRARVLLEAASAATFAAPPIPVQLKIEAHTATVPSSRELDAQALDDLHAASSPAPPLPPTAQERLVRLMLRRGEKHDLAQLDPAEQAAFASREQTAFHDFFDPPPDPRMLHQAEAEQEPQSTSTTQPKTEGQPQ